jgi:hypothetical protein
MPRRRPPHWHWRCCQQLPTPNRACSTDASPRLLPRPSPTPTAQNVGTILGGGIGLATGSGQSGSNRALRTLGGAAAGRGVGHLAGRSQAFEYTVLIGGMTSTRIISDQAGKRVGDCVAIEQGQFSNIRLVSDDRCAAMRDGTARCYGHHGLPTCRPPVPATRPNSRP